MSGRLVVIDLQQVFADPDSGWFTPRFAELLDPIGRLVAAYQPAVTFTRFVPPAQPVGAWQEYYRQWPFALRPPDAPLYALVERFAGRPTLDAPTFGKWGAELAAQAGPELVVAGVSTDCCVISTVLAAADAGVKVWVAADACAGATDESHQQALAVMRLYAPLVELTTVAELILERSAAGADGPE
ncbi:MAG: cysteine hydrolase family protein [Jatrophihabitantaceae bacterium]